MSTSTSTFLNKQLHVNVRTGKSGVSIISWGWCCACCSSAATTLAPNTQSGECWGLGVLPPPPAPVYAMSDLRQGLAEILCSPGTTPGKESRIYTNRLRDPVVLHK